MMLIWFCFLAVGASAQTSQTLQCEDWQIGAQALWDGPVLGTGKEIGDVNCGETVTLLSPIMAMTKIRTREGKEGYVPGRYFGLKSNPIKQGKPRSQKVDKKLQKITNQHPEWPANMVEAVRRHEVVVGMTYQMLVASIAGAFYLSNNETHTERHVYNQIHYGPCGCLSDAFHLSYFIGYVYLEDGIVTSYQTSY